MNLGRAAGDVGRGLVAGAAGTAALTAAMMIEAKRSGGGEANTTPAQAAEKVLRVQPEDAAAEQRLAQLVHWGYGTALGGARGLISAAGVREPAATGLHFALVWGAALAMLPAMRLAPPPTKREPQELAMNAGNHALYALVAGGTYDLLARSR